MPDNYQEDGISLHYTHSLSHHKLQNRKDNDPKDMDKWFNIVNARLFMNFIILSHKVKQCKQVSNNGPIMGTVLGDADGKLKSYRGA